MPDRILVINPNSTDVVTRAIDDAMAPLRITGGPGIDCVTLREGPPGVGKHSDADAVIAPLCRAIRGRARNGRFCDRLLQRPGPVLGTRGDREARARYRGMRDSDRVDPRPPFWRDLDLGPLGAAASALHRRDGSGAAARRRSAPRPWGLRARRWPQDAVAHDRNRLPTA